ncbi:MAG TPA: hypothetical protein ENI87_11365 [bacterium]|nr:hypothetical protein [bacterium]
MSAPADPLVVRIEHSAYLPFRRFVRFTESDRVHYRPIVPVDAGYDTGMVNASRGGRFSIEGLGTVEVDANVLSQDAQLRLIVVPQVSWSDLAASAGVMCFQVWLSARDAAGNPLSGALPPHMDGIRLHIQRSLTAAPVIPADAVNIAWTSHCVGDFSVGPQSQAAVVDDGSVSMPIGRGHNMLYVDYAVPADATGTCFWGPWKIDVRETGQRGHQDGPSVAVICGVITQTSSFSVSANDSYETDVAFEADNMWEFGVEGMTSLVSAAAAKAGYASTYSAASKRIKTQAKKQTLTTQYQETISGKPAGQQPSGYDCISGTKVHGMLFKKYDVFAVRYHTCGLPPFEKRLASFELYAGLTSWLEGPNGQVDPVWDTTCPGCAGGGTLPATLPLRPQ